MAQRLCVSVRSYYDYCSGKYQQRQSKKELIKKNINKSFEDSQKTYGSVRITSDLRVTNTPISRPTVMKYMRELGLRSKLTPKFTVRTTDSNHNNSVAENLLNREFIVSEPNRAWVSDITYIRTRTGFEYLTTVIDLFDRKVIGWSFSRDMTTENTVSPAFKMAWNRRGKSGVSDLGLIFHSDRGSQYTSKEFIKVLNKRKILRSNSRKGNCWDNAVAESFFKTLKCELIYHNPLRYMEQLRAEVFEYIECWYNKKRRHSAIGNLNIEEFWTEYYEKCKLLKTA